MRTSNIVGCCLSLAITLGAVAGGVGAAFAGDATATKPKIGAACKEDRKALCKEGGKVLACLRANKDKLSAGCSAALAALPAKKAEEKK